MQDALWESLVTAFVYSQLDYCNGTLKGVAAGTIRRLQLVLHATARLVVEARSPRHTGLSSLAAFSVANIIQDSAFGE